MPIFRKKVSQIVAGVLTLSFIMYLLLSAYLFRKISSSFERFELGSFRSVSPSSRTCKQKTNFVFVKCMKCATETLGTVFRRFGYTRNLTFVTPVGNKLYLGWPFQITKYDYRPSTRSFNIVMEHSVYNKTMMKALMPADTVYVTIVRQPYSHFKSVFTYFNLKNIANVTSSDPFSEYLHNVDRYEQIYKSPAAASTRYCIPDNFSVTKNLMSHCVGMPLGFPAGTLNITADDDAVERYIDQLDRDFSLVMIVEYFHESLILLKHLMCWTFKDIVYWNANVGNKMKKFDPNFEENENIYRKWSSVDYKLYDHFNKTFWEKIRSQPPDFFTEVQHLTTVQVNIVKFCTNPVVHKIVFHKTKWHEQFEFTSEDCGLLKKPLLKAIQERFDKQEHLVPPIRKPSGRNVPLC